MNLIYLYIFLQSNLLEVPFYHWILNRAKNPQWVRFLKLTTAINSLTHPIVFFVIMNFEFNYLTNILIAEAFAIAAETIFFYLYLRESWHRSFIAATAANLVSWQLAPLLTFILWK